MIEMLDLLSQIDVEVWIIFGASLASFLLLFVILYNVRQYAQGGQYRKNHRMDGKVVIITGSSSGIGFETALDLARRGARIYMACRNYEKCEIARLEIVRKSDNSNIYNRSLDLASFDSIRSFVSTFLDEETRLDVLINNAGVFYAPYLLTKEGHEMHFGVNYLGHFLLTNLLLDTLKKSEPSRIVNVSSYFYAQGHINKNDLDSRQTYDRISAYNQSKLALILFTRHLAHQLRCTRVTVNAVNPGNVLTNISRHMRIHRLAHAVGPVLSTFILKTPRSGAQTSIKVAVDPKLEFISGKYFSEVKEEDLVPHAEDEQTAEWLWNESLRLTELYDRNV
ncbi:retinol dehydrogenase 13-like [Phlebotomus papatasi]|uniref:retinol dehydrogenase 13-like n=1 Tax=Phlebotomus papatasi TaxID=29031 RepID=UPI002483F1D1|nr:retinol dehydrogenase 13-like [Phlebotomus papatasi]